MQKEEVEDILKQVSFENDRIQVLSVTRNGTKPNLPLTKGPINFSVMGPTGCLSHRWGVITNRKGDAYIYNRDVPDAEKVSLHASGEQHICISDKTAVRMGETSRFGPRWTEPVFDQQAVPTFSILFPSWGVINRFPKNLARRNVELLIAGHVEKTVVVGFIILDASKKLQGNTPHYMLGKLALRPGKVLYVGAWKEPERDWTEGLRAALEQIPSDAMEKIQASPEEGDLVINFQGFRERNSAFMAAVPVKERPASS